MSDPIRILLVEDNPGDVELMRANLDMLKILHQLHVVGDGLEAMAFLRREAPWEDAPRPDLVLLDVNLPGKSGHEVLADMKRDPELRTIAVVVLTSSEADEDILDAYKLQANAFVCKPVDLAGFGKIVRGIEGFWLSIVRYPPADR